MDNALLDKQATCAFFGGINPVTLHRGIAAGRYPKPIRVGPNSPRWLRSECEAALNAMIAARDGADDVEPRDVAILKEQRERISSSTSEPNEALKEHADTSTETHAT
jgi:predicted DNA-binding transcriptional regulator AlpA